MTSGQTQYGDTMLCLRRGEPTENNAWTRLTSSFVATFAKAGKEEFSSRSKEKHETPAHVFDVAHGAVDALRATKQNQAIVVLYASSLLRKRSNTDHILVEMVAFRQRLWCNACWER